MTILLLLGFLLIVVLVPLNLSFAESFNAIKIVEDSITQVDGRTLQLTNMHERQFHNSPIVKVQAEAISGETVLIFLNVFNPDFTKVIVFDGQFKKGKLIKNPITVQESLSETDKPSILEYEPKLDFKYFISAPISLSEDFTIQVRTYDAREKFGGYFSNLNSLGNVKIKIELQQEKTEFVGDDDSTRYERILIGEWKTKKIMEGTTNKFGKWTGGEPLFSNTFDSERWMKVRITAMLGEQIVEKTEQVYVIEQSFGRTSSSR